MIRRGLPARDQERSTSSIFSKLKEENRLAAAEVDLAEHGAQCFHDQIGVIIGVQAGITVPVSPDSSC